MQLSPAEPDCGAGALGLRTRCLAAAWLAAASSDQDLRKHVLCVQVKHRRFSELKADVERSWHALPRQADVISPNLRAKIKTNAARLEKSQLTDPADVPQQPAHQR